MCVNPSPELRKRRHWRRLVQFYNLVHYRTILKRCRFRWWRRHGGEVTCQRRASLSSRRSYLINLPPWLIKRCRFGGYFVLISYGKVYLLPFDLPRVYYILECVSDETLTCFFSLPFFFFFCHCLSVSGFFFLESWKKQWRFGRSFEGRLLMAVTPLIFLRWVSSLHPKKIRFILFVLKWSVCCFFFSDYRKVVEEYEC